MAEVSVRQALSRGKFQLVYIPIVIFIALLALPFFIAPEEKIGWALAGGFAGGTILAWLYWSFAVTYWRIWAFGNVRNVHELRRRAIADKLIHPEGSMYSRTEIATASQKRKLLELENEFMKEDIFRDDRSLPKEFSIYISRSRAIVEVILGGILFVGAIWAATREESKFFACISLLFFGTVLVFTGGNKLSIKKPLLTLNSDGIKSDEFGFISWSKVKSWNIVSRSNSYDLEINGGEYTMNVSDLKIGIDKLKDIIEIYNSRYENSQIRHRSNSPIRLR